MWAVANPISETEKTWAISELYVVKKYLNVLQYFFFWYFFLFFPEIREKIKEKIEKDNKE